MNAREDGYSKITNADLARFETEANRLLARVRWRPELSGENRLKLAKSGWPENVLAATQVETALPEDFRVLDNDALVLSQSTNTVLEVLRDGAAIGLYIQDDLAKRIGLETLEQNDRLKGDGMSAEVRHRKNLLSAIQIFVLAYYVVWNLRDFHQDTRVAMQKPFPGVAEITHDFSTGDQASVYRSVLHYYAQLVRTSNGLINTREELIDATVRYFQAVLEHVKKYIIPGLQNGELFNTARYSLEGSGFAVSAFDELYAGIETEADEIRKVLFSSIIGNHVAKNRLERAAKLMFLRDKETGTNPAMRYGSIPDVVMLLGKPGAGKTEVSLALLTYAQELAKKTGLRVKIVIYPRNIVSKYQGVSSERAIALWKTTKDPGCITLVFMDEAEELVPARDDENVSSGSKAGTNAFLVATEGAEQTNTGIRLILLATNHAHLCDSAVRSRAKEKIEVNGAETAHDYIDFIHMSVGRQDEAFQGILKLEKPKDYEFMMDQKNAPDPEGSKDTSRIIRGVDAIEEHAKKKFRALGYDFFGELFYQFQRANPNFSLRDVRNIISATIFDLSQYDIPESFFDPTSPDYFQLNLEGKERVLRDLLDTHLHNTRTRFSDKLLSNALRQMKEIEKVEEIEHKRSVEKQLKQIAVQAEAILKAREMGIQVH